MVGYYRTKMDTVTHWLRHAVMYRVCEEDYILYVTDLFSAQALILSLRKQEVCISTCSVCGSLALKRLCEKRSEVRPT